MPPSLPAVRPASEESKEPTTSQGKQQSEQEAPPAAREDGGRWWSLVAGLSVAPETSVVETLQDACTAASEDPQWAQSGVFALLTRALEAAKGGDLEQARRQALGVADFHNQVLRLRQSVSSERSEGKRSPSRAHSGNSGGEVASAEAGSKGGASPSKRSAEGVTSAMQGQQQQQQEGNTEAADVTAPHDSGSKRERGSSGGDDADGDEAAAKRCRAAADDTAEACDGAAVPPGGSVDAAGLRSQPLEKWEGAVRLRLPSGGVVPFIQLAMQVPAPLLDELPRDGLVVTAIKPRKGLVTQGQLACGTVVTAAGRDQVAELRQMAELELVAVAPLQDCGAIIVPFLSSTGGVKAVTFLAALA